jgi:8-oxo-dGTP diphosphatase
MSEVIFYRGVSAIPVNAEGKILLQLRDDRPDLNYPNHWSCLGGAAEGDETFDEAIRRELLEEIEIDLSVKLWKTQHYPIEIRDRNYIVDICTYVGRIDLPVSEIKLNEGQALGYFGLDELDSIQIGFNFEVLYREFFAALADGTLPL